MTTVCCGVRMAMPKAGGLLFLLLAMSIDIRCRAQTLDSLLSSRGYDRFLRPSFDSNAVEVNMSMTISSIDQISEVNMDYTITVFLRQYWKDERLAFSNANQSLSLDGRLAEKLWVPDTFIPNAKESFMHKVTVDNRLIRLDPDGGILYGMRITAKAACDMDLGKYPMDSQNCTLEFESYGYKTDDIVFHWKNGNASIYGVESLKLQQFIIGEYNVIEGTSRYESEEGQHSNVRFCFKLHRQAFYFIFQTYLPATLLVVLSWVSFWINSEAVPARVALGITTVLTMTTLISGARATMPKISYIKAIDVYLITCFLFTFAALVEYAAVNFRSSRVKASKRKMSVPVPEPLNLQEESEGISMKKLNNEGADAGARVHTILDIDVDNGNAGKKKVQVDMDISEDEGDRPKKMGLSFRNGMRSFMRQVSQVPLKGGVAVIDKYSRWLFPISYSLFNIFYYVYYNEPWVKWTTPN
ncbi:GABRB1 [Branchiostoma lanceolatum]|uniref:GABRB1 protein n=1 Tax=Branchiostoma lanceolatum TaxID=7740 RepID=A0A8J9ZKV9_BRALA|nr:GABRB1 [Branchiostoma lanceolatum]